MKAARGAGLPWGIADEAGWAVQWLTARGLNGAGALDRSLRSFAQNNWRQMIPEPEPDIWHAPAGMTDGLLAGITFADLAQYDLFYRRRHLGFRIEKVSNPLLLLPFLESFASFSHEALNVFAGGRHLFVGVSIEGMTESCSRLDGMAIAEFLLIEPRSRDELPKCIEQLDGSLPIDDDAYARLEHWAQKTYVPESAESQARGAGGADLIETD